MKTNALAKTENTGARLFKLDNADIPESISEQAEHKYNRCQEERRINEEEITDLSTQYDDVCSELKKEKGSHSSAVKENRRAKIGMSVAFFMGSISSILIYNSLGPSFYQKEILAGLISLGGGLTILIGTELLLQYLTTILNSRQANLFMISTTLVILTAAIGGGIMLAKARALQSAVQAYAASDSVLDADSLGDLEGADIDKIKKKIDMLNGRAMVLLFIGFEWLAGVLLFRAIRSIQKNGSQVALIKKRNFLRNKITKLKKRNAYLNGVTKDTLVLDIMQAGKKGSPLLLISTVTILLAAILFIFLWTEDVFGEESCRSFLVGYDVTGSTEHDQIENERAALRTIDRLKPCDEIQIILITENTFSDPEYMLSYKMPSKAGYFNEEVKRKKIQIMRDYKEAVEQLCHKRPATSLIDGIFLFSRILKEQYNKKKILVIFSDMRQFTKDINDSMIVTQGDSIIEKLKADALIPDMRGIDIYVMGASTAGLSIQKWQRLERFWRKFFSYSGGNLECYDMGRNIIF